MGLSKKNLRNLSPAAKESYFIIFNEKLYKQIDGVTMGSPLGPSFPYPFLARFEKNWLQNYPTNFRMIQIWRP